MSTAAPIRPPRRPLRPVLRPAAGSTVLLRSALRRHRVRLAVWVLALGGLALYATSSLGALYPDAAARRQRALLMGNPAAVFLGGPGYGLDDYTRGAMVADELGLVLALAAAVMSVQLVVRETRAPEEDGHLGLLRTGCVGPLAPLVAASALALAADLAVALLVAAGLAATGLAVVDAVAFGLGVALTGLVFAGVAAVAAQLSAHARTASGTALALLGAAELVRGAGDVGHRGGSALSWLSPIAWAQQTRAFVEVRWWPLLLPAALAVVLLLVAAALAGGRDEGAGALPVRAGRTRAGAALAGPAGLAWRLRRGAVLGWALSLTVAGAVFGSFTASVRTAFAGNPQVGRLLASTGSGDLGDAFTAVIAQDLALAVAAFAVSSVLRLRAEEVSGRLSLLLSGPVARSRVVLADLAVTLVVSTGLLLLAGLGAGVAAAAATGDPRSLAPALGALAARWPAVLVLTAVTVALVGLAPRAAGAVWVLFAAVAALVLLGPLLRLPGWVGDLSPFGWTPDVPAQPLRWAPLLVLTALGVLGAAAGVSGLRRRDLLS